jgi:hypothetical protein
MPDFGPAFLPHSEVIDHQAVLLGPPHFEAFILA